jgi:tRNA(Ile)-lysidine synthase
MVETRRLTELTARLADLLDTPEGDISVALSGGADSATLAYLLTTVGRSFRAIHIDHGLPDSPILAKAARAVAESVGADLDVVTIDVPAGASLEAQARRVRYEAFLERLAPGEWLLTAHTRDDQAETVLMNLLRGSGPTGIAGIPPRSGPVARPMLAVSRSDARELAGLANLPFFDDPTNLDPSIRRNSIRLEILPNLSARFNPRLIETLARSADLVRLDDSYLREESGSVSVLARDSSVAVALGELWVAPRPMADRVLRFCLARIRPPHSGTSDELDQIWAVAGGERRAVTLTGGVAVAVEGPLLVFEPEGQADRASDPVDLVVGANRIGRFQVTVEHVDRVCRVAPLGSWSAIFDPGARLRARVGENGRLLVEAGAETAWLPGERRLGVAWYQPGTSGYLSVFAREESGWTSSL